MAEYADMIFRELNAHERHIEQASFTSYAIYIGLASAAIATGIQSNQGLLFSTRYCLLIGLVSGSFIFLLSRLRWWKNHYMDCISQFIAHYSVPTDVLPYWMVNERKNDPLPGIHRHFRDTIQYLLPQLMLLYCGLVVAYNFAAWIFGFPSLETLFPT